MVAETNKGKEKLFVESLTALGNDEQKLFLGSKESVESILREASIEYFEGIVDLDHGESAGNLAYRIGVRKMGVFIKLEGPGHTGLRGWNVPGGVDEFAAKWIGVEAERPLARMAGVFMRLIEELLEIQAVTDVQTAEQWTWQVDAVFEKYAMILLGISPPQQALM